MGGLKPNVDLLGSEKVSAARLLQVFYPNLVKAPDSDVTRGEKTLEGLVTQTKSLTFLSRPISGAFTHLHTSNLSGFCFTLQIFGVVNICFGLFWIDFKSLAEAVYYLGLKHSK